MKNQNKLSLAVSLVVIVVAVATVGLAAHHQSKSQKHTASQNAATAAGHTSAKTVTDTSPTNNTPAADNPAAANTATVPNNTACQRLPLVVAQKVLGASAQYQSPNGTVKLSETKDTSVSACAYAAAADSVQFAVREPKNSLGASENATAFGSERPSGAASVDGYGQSAYWNPATHTLNILSNNNWYAISRSSGTQADAEAVATAIKAEL